MSDSKLILVTGATGYVGGRLVPRLQGRPWLGGVEVVSGDMLQPDTLGTAMRNVEAVYYLVHSLSGGSNFSRLDVTAAQNCARTASMGGVERIIYLGGLGNPDATWSNRED